VGHLALSRLWAPALLFVLAIVCAIVVPDLPRLTGADPSAKSFVAAGYAAQIALWLGGAFLVIRLVDLFFWDRLVVRTLGRSVPRLLKDAVGLIIFLFAVAAIVGVVFGESLTGIWATSGVIGIVLGLALRSIILDIFSGLAINVDGAPDGRPRTTTARRNDQRPLHEGREPPRSAAAAARSTD
jgi:small-conductance mechanosensitive channel